MFHSERIEFNHKPFRKKPRENRQLQEALQRIIDRQNGRRRRWDIPLGEYIENNRQTGTPASGNPDVMPVLRQIIRKQR